MGLILIELIFLTTVIKVLILQLQQFALKCNKKHDEFHTMTSAVPWVMGLLLWAVCV